jgi:hypothetical protein
LSSQPIDFVFFLTAAVYCFACLIHYLGLISGQALTPNPGVGNIAGCDGRQADFKAWKKGTKNPLGTPI